MKLERIGVLVSPSVSPPERYAEALVGLLGELGTIEVPWEPYRARADVETYAVRIRLPGGKVFQVKLV